MLWDSEGYWEWWAQWEDHSCWLQGKDPLCWCPDGQGCSTRGSRRHGGLYPGSWDGAPARLWLLHQTWHLNNLSLKFENWPAEFPICLFLLRSPLKNPAFLPVLLYRQEQRLDPRIETTELVPGIQAIFHSRCWIMSPLETLSLKVFAISYII